MMVQQLRDIQQKVREDNDDLDEDDDDEDDDSFSAPMIDASYLRAESQNNVLSQ